MLQHRDSDLSSVFLDYAASTLREYLVQIAAVVVLAADAAKRLSCVRMLLWQMENAAAGPTTLFGKLDRIHLR